MSWMTAKFYEFEGAFSKIIEYSSVSGINNNSGGLRFGEIWFVAALFLDRGRWTVLKILDSKSFFYQPPFTENI